MRLYGMLASPRAIIFVVFLASFVFWYVLKKGENEYSEKYHSVDCIVPAYNEELTIARTLNDLLVNRYVDKVVAIDDGSTDSTLEILRGFKSLHSGKMIVVSQSNTGKAGAINNALGYTNSDAIFLTDADIRIPNDNGLGYLLKALENGADAVTGIPGSDLTDISFGGKIRASVKIFFATFRKCAGEILGGSPFCISGSVGMYKSHVLKDVLFSAKTCVEDLDLTWELVGRGFKVAQSARAIVFSQEAASFADDMKRWRRWISGYAACMRIHKRLLMTRFGLTTIIPNFLIGLYGVIFLAVPFVINYTSAVKGIILWLLLLVLASGYSAYKQGKAWWLILYSPFSILVILQVFLCWLLWGLPTLVTGDQVRWAKVRRY